MEEHLLHAICPYFTVTCSRQYKNSRYACPITVTGGGMTYDEYSTFIEWTLLNLDTFYGFDSFADMAELGQILYDAQRDFKLLMAEFEYENDIDCLQNL
jgi:hypothetical protein